MLQIAFDLVAGLRKGGQTFLGRTLSSSKNNHCKVCRADLKRNGSFGKSYCSHRCSLEDDFQGYITRWLAGEEPGGTPGRLSRYVRRWVFAMRGRRCESCGWDKLHPKTGKAPLEINHIDGNSSNHAAENLEILCPNCHSLTQYHGSLNQGKGRKSRQKIVKES